MGSASLADLQVAGDRIAGAMAAGEALPVRDWTRAMVATEIVFASEVLGTGSEWTVINGGTDAYWVGVLRSLQRKVPQGRRFPGAVRQRPDLPRMVNRDHADDSPLRRHDAGMEVLFMYGAGEDGPGAWPAGIRRCGGTFLQRVPGVVGDNPVVDCARLVEAGKDRPVHIVAVSYGGIAAVLAAQQAPSRVRSLTLFEPACASFAPTAQSVAAARGAFDSVVAQRDDATVSDLDFLDGYSAAAGAVPPGEEHEALLMAQRLRSSPLPWEVPIAASKLLVPTLVVTGQWSDFYEDIADGLAAVGARRRRLPGFGHSVLDHPGALSLLDGLVNTGTWP